MARWLLLPVLAVALAGCGGGAHRVAGTSTAAATTVSSRAACVARAEARALTRLRADIAALKRAAALPTKDARAGNAAVNRATDRFLNDVATAPVDNLVRNRMIDHAAAVLLGACEQCFQALEAERPIPAIAQGQGQRGSCGRR